MAQPKPTHTRTYEMTELGIVLTKGGLEFTSAKWSTYRVAGTGAVSSAVPVGSGITKAVTDGNGLVAELSESREHVLSQVHGSLLVNIVADLEPLAAGSSSGRDVALENVLGILDQSGVVVLVVVLQKSVILV